MPHLRHFLKNCALWPICYRKLGFKDGFCPDLLLDILAQVRATASALQQQEYESSEKK